LADLHFKASVVPNLIVGGLGTQQIAVTVDRMAWKTTRQSERMVRRYIRDAELYRDNAAAATSL